MAIVVECPTINVSPQGLLIRTPGGGELSVMSPIINPTGLQVAKPLLGQVNAALSPLIPVFNIIDAVLSVQDCIKAVPKAITSLSPKPISDCISDLAKKTAKLANLVPQLSVPLMIVDIIDAFLSTLNGIIDELEAIVVQEAKIAAASTAASQPGNESLAAIVQCSTAVVAQQKQGLSAGLGPLNSLIGVLNLFLELIGFEALPDLADLPEDSQDAIDGLRSAVELLEKIRDAIPVP